MKHATNDGRARSLEPSLSRRWSVLELFRTASTQMLVRTGIAVAVAWLPLFVLCAIRGGGTLLSFLKDYASHSRFLIVLPVLILAELLLQSRLRTVANHFETFVIPQNQIPEFHAGCSSSSAFL